MIKKINENLELVKAFSTDSKEEAEAFRIKYLGKKGILNNFFLLNLKLYLLLKRKDYGQSLNLLKKAVTDKVKAFQLRMDTSSSIGSSDDLTRPGFPIDLGSRHPLSLVKSRIVDIFAQIGFNISHGPEIEDDWHNFTI